LSPSFFFLSPSLLFLLFEKSLSQLQLSLDPLLPLDKEIIAATAGNSKRQEHQKPDEEQVWLRLAKPHDDLRRRILSLLLLAKETLALRIKCAFHSLATIRGRGLRHFTFLIGFFIASNCSVMQQQSTK